MTQPSLAVGYIPGATPAKWARVWAERHPDIALRLSAVEAADAVDAVRTGAVDVALLRPPVDPSGLAVIPLYAETTVVVLPVDHLMTALDEVSAADLADEPVVIPLDDVVGWSAGVPVEHRPETTKDATELVAAGMGLLVVPQSLARLHHRKDLSYRPISDAPACPVALAFPDREQTPLVEEFVGIVRGRTSSSSRGRAEPAPKRTAREKTLAKQAARAAAGKTAGKPVKRGRR
ncbi:MULTISPECIES: LysR family substrate-binding domain-containing protein [Mycobacteriaceae]|uniref:LysR family transcriptional regulator n=1 Tax=Mycolicibacterium neoaurum VKM Ac-1815D TaxID=700508 RepID=V5XAS3_MYCNE|nr:MULTISPECIES: LysR family substrate-binding domain-containing protein [Mycobacteriaceae]AHC24938.1 LysR family transcriptional regulator [Mycolicibacterium neoaurum VKM Ac-1815D]AMO05472.1 LysR family transcriptional regulator [Mycolicibacterium neoaurum]AXK76210.1 LysR family transcriptional regulator [Mycolicibacterium neoaurum]KJQ50684.1 LysR family transcriptional regulator [Mycolicibacterium neoaurum]KUM09868.1 LysR family transcriptional regulator [Mycolicibacterium neoaurum]